MKPAQYRELPVDLIDDPPHRLRTEIDPATLGDLADSMATEGLHQPVGCRGPLESGRYEIVWGHRRLLAARLLKWRHIAAHVFNSAFDPLLAAVSENLQRTDLNPVEEAEAVQRFIDRGHPIQGIARLFRRSITWVHSRVALAHQPDDVKQAVASGAVSLTVAATLGEIDHEPYRRSLLAEAIRTGATQAVAEVWRAHYLSDRERIVANSYIPAEIAERRAAFKITTQCDWCDEDTAFEDSRSFRLCMDCATELVEAKGRAVQQATTQHP